ncbi:MAG: SRPBCC domain-containing protein, partial [Polyangiales bacterium]
MAPSENATEELKLSALIPASPNAIYAAWMDERRHSAFTAGRATVDQWVGGRVTAVDSFVDATHILLDTGRRIVMTWRTADFPVDSPDSQVEVSLEPGPGGTRVSIHQTGIPAG